MASACPSCSTRLPYAARFCPRCGTGVAGRGLLWIGILAALSIPIWMMLVFWWLASDPATPEPKHEPHTRPIPYVQPAPEPELKR